MCKYGNKKKNNDEYAHLNQIYSNIPYTHPLHTGERVYTKYKYTNECVMDGVHSVYWLSV